MLNASIKQESKYFLENETKIDNILDILQYKIDMQHMHNFNGLLEIAGMEYLFLNNEYSDLEILSNDISNFWTRSYSGDMKITCAILLYTNDFEFETRFLKEILGISKNIVEFRFPNKTVHLNLLNLLYCPIGRRSSKKYESKDYLKIMGRKTIIYYSCMMHEILSKFSYQTKDHSMSFFPVFHKKLDDKYYQFFYNFLTQVLSLFSERKICKGFLVAGNQKLNECYFDELNKFDVIPYAFSTEFYKKGRNLSLSLDAMESNKTLDVSNDFCNYNISFKLLKILETENKCFKFTNKFSSFLKKTCKSADKLRFEYFTIQYYIKDMSLEFELNPDPGDMNLLPDKSAVDISLISDGISLYFKLIFNLQTRELLDIEFDESQIKKKVTWSLKNKKKYLSSVFNKIIRFALIWDLRDSD
ncbi:hypothetical protein CWI39_0379p0010 [Hamiltosporidium magnivora]|uniref:Uncharacterized protein n=1 Tax=Hamiltosporidium magnivora TaxID=148818 RepID=A0A4Q9LG45_9MICR|nr:hypothetical protein CWI39_0379p0010 [Hamiltosporidium magnivora]